MGSFIQTPRNKKEIVPVEHPKITIPRHESHSAHWEVCLISSGVLYSSHCHNLASFNCLECSGWAASLWISDQEHFLASSLPPVFALPKSTFQLDLHFKRRVGVGGGDLREQLPNKDPFSASLWREVEMGIQNLLGIMTTLNSGD